MEPDLGVRNGRQLRQAGIAMDWRELFALSHVPLTEWLDHRKVSPLPRELIFILCANLWITTVGRARASASVTGLFAYMRLLVCAEGFCASILPNAHDGLFVPMAKAIDQRGGTVLRGRKVSEILIENDQAVGVVLSYMTGNTISVDGAAAMVA